MYYNVILIFKMLKYKLSFNLVWISKKILLEVIIWFNYRLEMVMR